MESFYSDLEINKLFVPKEQYPAPPSVHQHFLPGIYEEESVDFSAIVAACENPSPNFYAPGSCASSSSGGGPTTAEYYDPAETSFPFDLMPGIYGNETGGYPASSQTGYTSSVSCTSTKGGPFGWY